MMRMAVAGQEILQPHHVAERGGPISTGPPTPPWIRLTRRRISARMMRSPRSASATSSARNLLRRNQQRLDVAFGMAVDQRDAAGELADLGQKLPRPLIDDRRDMAEPVALGDRDMARQHHEHAGPGLAGLEQHFAVPVSCAPRRTAACARSPAASASERSARGAETRQPLAADWLSMLLVSSLVQPFSPTRLPAHERNSGYRPGFSPPASSSAASAFRKMRRPASLRPRACDLRRLRFSRSASFSRSCRES